MKHLDEVEACIPRALAVLNHNATHTARDLPMVLLEPGYTPYDLRFRVMGIPVRVHPMFWLVTAIMGFNALNEQNGLARFGIWVACMFFSILIHEMGHVLMGRFCGTDGKIVLYAFGGLAIPDRHLYNRWQRIAVSSAGPLAQFLLVAVLATGVAAYNREDLEPMLNMLRALVGLAPDGNRQLDLPDLVQEAIWDLLLINIFWALLNLLPIWPLDGGQIARDFLDGAMRDGQGIRVSLGISLALAVLLTIHCIVSARGGRFIPFLPRMGIFGALLFGSLAIESWQLLQQQSNRPWRRDDW
jgi:Zn-dependent protease